MNGFSTPTAHGFWLAFANGDVVTNGEAHFYGSAVQTVGRPDYRRRGRAGGGYWLDASDGGIFGRRLGAWGGTSRSFSLPVGHGYWLVARDGGIFTFGGAHLRIHRSGVGPADVASVQRRARVST